MADERKERFQRMFEVADLQRVPTLGGWTRKVSEMEQHRANFGEVNEAGCFLVQSGRKTNHTVERVLDFFNCLPGDREHAALIICLYVDPAMLEEYPGVLNIGLRRLTVSDSCQWVWNSDLSKSTGKRADAFWRRWSKRQQVYRVLAAAGS